MNVADVVHFLYTHVRGLAHRDILQLMGSMPYRSWTAREIARAIGRPAQLTYQYLNSLVCSGILTVEETGGHVYYRLTSDPSLRAPLFHWLRSMERAGREKHLRPVPGSEAQAVRVRLSPARGVLISSPR